MKKERAGISERLVAVLKGPDGKVKDIRVTDTNPAKLLRRIIARVRRGHEPSGDAATSCPRKRKERDDVE